MNNEERIYQLERTVEALVLKDKEVDRFCEDILDSVKKIGDVVNLSNGVQSELTQVVKGIIAEIGKLQSK